MRAWTNWKFANLIAVILLSGFVLALSVVSLSPKATAGAPVPILLPGQSATLLADGQWLLLGGGEGGRPSNDVWRVDPRTGDKQPLTVRLSQARSEHTATMLPDGRVLVFGGVGSDGAVVQQAEVFNPAGARFDQIEIASLTPRAGHSTTVLTDGRVLVSGGAYGAGGFFLDAELWDARSAKAEILTYSDANARRGAAARLLPDGSIVFVNGTGVDNQPAAVAFRYLPDAQRFEALSTADAARSIEAVDQATASHLVATFPRAGAEDFLPDGTLALRFSAPLDVTTLNERSVLLMGPHGAVPASIVPAEAGMLLFVTPKISLFPGARHTLFLDGVVGVRGVPLDFQAFDFGTATLPTPAPQVPPPATEPAPTAPTPVPIFSPPASVPPTTGPKPKSQADDPTDDEVFLPGPEHHGGRWRTGRALPRDLAKRNNNALAKKGALAYEDEAKKKPKPPKLHRATPEPAAGGGPGVAGQVLRLNDKPLSNVSVSIGTLSTQTDAQGYFRLTGVPTGRQELFVDGTRGGGQGRQYGNFVIGVDVVANRTTDVPPIFLPRIRAQDWIPISSPLNQDRVITHPNVPGMEIHIPKGAVLRERDGRLVTRIALVPIPLDRIPFAFPENAPVYVSVQPGGLVVQGLSPKTTQGIRVIYPNLSDEPAGGAADFWRYDAAEKGWYVYGQGHASADGKQIVPDPGVAVYESIGFMYTPAPNGPRPPLKRPKCRDVLAGDPVSCSSGLFLHRRTDVSLPDIMPLEISSSYRPGDTVYRSFGRGTAHAYEMSLYFPSTSTYATAQLVLADGGVVDFTRVSPGTDPSGAVFESQSDPSEFFKSRITPNLGTSRWLLQTKDGMTYEFSNTAGIPLVAMSDRHGNTITITRSGGLIQRLTTPSGRYVDFTYDLNNRITQLIDSSGRTWSYAYNAASYLSRATAPDASFEEYTYDAAGGPMLTVQDRRGNIMVTNVYDANGRVSQQTLADGGIYQFSYTADANDQITRTDVTDPRGSVTRYDFNGAGHLASQTLGLGTSLAQTTTYERQAGTNLLLATVDSLGRRTEHSYDAMGNRLSTTRLAGTAQAVTRTNTYEPAYNQVASHTDALGQTTTFTYGATGNLTQVTDPLGNTVRLTYNAAGQPLTVTDPLNQAFQLSYDLGDLIAVTDPLGRVTQGFTDLLGRLLVLTDPLGRRTRYQYDALDRITAVTDAMGQLTQLAYDGNGNLLSVTDARGGQTQHVYDAKNRLTQRTDPLLKSETFGYDGKDNVTRYTDRKGQLASLGYDALNRRTQATFADGTATYTYDAANRLTQATDSAGGNVTRSYDNLSRLAAETTPQGSVTYGYDAANRRTGLTVAGQSPVTYSYDAANRLTQLTQGPASVQFAYDAASRRTRLTLPNGIQASYAYDAASQLTGITYNQGTTTIGDLHYTYDALGNRTQITGTLARTNLPPALTAATHDQANRLTSWNGANITYDANGNMLNDGARSYTWDARNRLAAIAGPVTASFQYDAFGRRSQKTVNGTTTSYLYDGRNPVQELAGSTPTANLLTGLNIDEYFRRTDSQGTRDFLTDALGSTLALADSTGAIQTSYTYDPFGNTTITGQASTNSFQYTGRENDGTGLYFYRARYYSSQYQRFISQDPIGFAGGDVNLYAYVGGGPVRYRDPLGLSPIGIAVGVGVRVIGGRAAAAAIGAAARRYGPAGMVAACLLAGVCTFNEEADDAVEPKPDREQKPEGCPVGTKPVDKDKRLDRETIHGIKDDLRAEPKDWVGISPDGRIWTNEGGQAVDNGHYTDFIP